jgi:transposase InsO family protein
MSEERRKNEALFRYAVLGDLVTRELSRGELGRGLSERAAKVWRCPDGRERRIAVKTLQEWLYRYKHHGFDGLLPAVRRDCGRTRVLRAEIEELILKMKYEDPGRSAPLIHRELELTGRLRRGEVSTSTIRRVLRRAGLSGPRMEVERPARLRWQASCCGELWQGDALHGPSLFDPASGRAVRVKIFALLDDRSRLVPYVRGDFHETQTEFLRVLLGAVLRRGIPRAILLDNHGSFTGSDVTVAAAKLGVRLVFARPHDGPSKGKIERWWRTLRAHVLDRLDLTRVTTLDDLNMRLSAWVETEYNTRPHAGLGGRTPLEVWEEDAEEIRWVDDPAQVEAAFTDKLTRQVRADSTCQVHGCTYEVPPELRGRSVEIHYSLLHPGRLWVEDGRTRIPIREVDPEANARRARRGKPSEKKEDSPPTGLNPVEEILRRLTQKKKGEER